MLAKIPIIITPARDVSRYVELIQPMMVYRIVI